MERWQRYKQQSCLMTAQRCLMADPLSRLLLGALRSRGCPLSLKRHLACEPCEALQPPSGGASDTSLRGGFDQSRSQIVMCTNASLFQPSFCQTLRHELVHAFDACRAAVDYQGSLDHLACTEIRAYNLAEPSDTPEPPGGHQAWVRDRAVLSLLAVRPLTRPEAEAAVDRVFTRCYSDLEPIGRRPMPPDAVESIDQSNARLAVRQAKFYGYWGEWTTED